MTPTKTKSKKNPTTATSARPLALGGALLAVALLGALAATAQTAPKRTVRGQVLDENDRVVAGAVVSLANLSSKVRSTMVTDKDGRYQFNEVPKKFDYEVSAEFEGKKARPRRLSQFDPRNIAVLNFKLEPPGESTEKKDDP